MKIIVIEPNEPACVEEFERFGLADMQAIVGGMIECAVLEDGIDLWFNEEGTIRNLPANRLVPRYGPLRGTYFIARSNDKGETKGLNEAQIKRWLEEVGDWPVAIQLGM